MPQVFKINTILLSLPLKPSQCCGFIEVNSGAGVDAGEGGGEGNREVGIAREVHLGVSVVRP